MPITALDAAALVDWMVAVLMAKAWQCLTVTAVREGGKAAPAAAPGAAAAPGVSLRRDLAGARLTIDALNALVPVVEGRVRPEEATQLRLALAGLRLEYVRAQGAPGPSAT